MNRMIVRTFDFDDTSLKLGVGAGGVIPRSYQALKNVRPELSAPACEIILAIAYFESGFGAIDMKNGFLHADGSPSHNWGGRKGPGDAGCIMHGDADEVGEVCFSAYSSPEAGARGFFNTRAWGSSPYRERTLAAANLGDCYGVAKAMYEGAYYSGFGCNGKVASGANKTPENIQCAILNYAKAISSTVSRTIAPALGMPNYTYLRVPSTSAAGTVGKVLVVGALGAGLTYVAIKTGVWTAASRLIGV